ncbi:MAG: hypothetical protein NT062_31245 [Proteobacteria bacterium]|nr:hypothetical protein [Pseudomonadota bacterium]
MKSASLASLLTLTTFATGCTHWTTGQTFGPRQEVARRLLGSPQVEEVTSSALSAGFLGGTGPNMAGGTMASGGLSGTTGTVKRTHCVQQAQVDYVQQVDFSSHMTGRGLDIAGSLIVGLIGLSIVSAAANNYQSDLDFYNTDPSFFSKPSSPTGSYAFGGGMAIGGAAWLIYSLTSLPKGPAPMMPPQQRAFTETTYVEAQGCGLVPADRPAAP